MEAWRQEEEMTDAAGRASGAVAGGSGLGPAPLIPLPSKPPRDARLLMLYVLAVAYPGSLTVDELAFILDGLMSRNALYRALHYSYYYYRAVERVSRGVYRASPSWLAALEERHPTWRVEFERLCIKYKVCERIIYVLGEINLSANLPTLTNPYQSLPSNTCNTKPKKPKHPGSLGRYRRLLTAIREYITERARGLAEELGGDLVKAAEILTVLLVMASRGRAYLVASNPRRLAYTLQDLARSLLGGSSSIAGIIDPDRILELVALLRDAQLVFYARYGADYKLRIDRAVEAELASLLAGPGV